MKDYAYHIDFANGHKKTVYASSPSIAAIKAMAYAINQAWDHSIKQIIHAGEKGEERIKTVLKGNNANSLPSDYNELIELAKTSPYHKGALDLYEKVTKVFL